MLVPLLEELLVVSVVPRPLLEVEGLVLVEVLVEVDEAVVSVIPFEDEVEMLVVPALVDVDPPEPVLLPRVVLPIGLCRQPTTATRAAVPSHLGTRRMVFSQERWGKMYQAGRGEVLREDAPPQALR